MIIKGFNVRVTEDGRAWIPRRDKEVIAYLDEQFMRTSPTELMWDTSKPKEDITLEDMVPEPDKEIYSLVDDMDLDGEPDDEDLS